MQHVVLDSNRVIIAISEPNYNGRITPSEG